MNITIDKSKLMTVALSIAQKIAPEIKKSFEKEKHITAQIIMTKCRDFIATDFRKKNENEN